jgi:hypothetical protein
MSEGTGRNLEPSRFGITPGQNLDPSPNAKPDKFGQVWNNQKDVTGGGLPSAAEVNRLHHFDDSDSSPQSHHHTLGPGRNQASPGNHIHDGTTSPKIGLMTIGTSGSNPVPAFTLTGSKGGNVALANLLTFLAKHFNFTDSTS